MPLRFEVRLLPVADVDRAKAFYERLGWRLDADFPLGEHDRIIQFTPPGSPASIQFGTGLTDMAPGSIEGLYLIVDDLDAAHKDLIGHGAQVSDIWHGRGLGKEGMEPGPDPGRSSCGAYMDARERGMSPDEAAEAAGRYMAEVKHVEAASA